jgi:hypothetical protein
MNPSSPYPHLFKSPPPDSGPATTSTFPQDQWIVPIEPPGVTNPSTVRESLSKKLGPAGLLRLEAMDYTYRFLSGKPTSSDRIEELYDIIFNKITNGKRNKKLGKQSLR